MRTELATIFVEFIPENENLVEGIIYVSEKYKTSTHLCPCGCGNLVVLPFGNGGWQYLRTNDEVTFSPSVGNFQFPCKSHYFIERNHLRHV
jgi:hypothetical protein